MKKLYSLIIIMLFAVTINAQSLNIYMNDGNTSNFVLANIDSITFTTSQDPGDLGDLGDLHDPILQLQFDEDPYNHNMHIASDGLNYYTINGGNVADGRINKFALDGTLLQTYPIQIDGRGLSYNSSDGFLYASLYTGDIVKITSLEDGTFETIYEGFMQDAQASFALSPDGTKLYDFANGILNVWSFVDGALLETITDLSYGPGNYGGNAAVAVDGDYIYTWDSSTKTVYVYSNSGSLIRTLVLSDGDNGQSLSVFDGYLFVSKDGSYNIGTWYGYNIRLSTLSTMITNENNSTVDDVRNSSDDSTK